MADNKAAEAKAAGVKAYCDSKNHAPLKSDKNEKNLLLLTGAGCGTGLLVGMGIPLVVLGGCALGAGISYYGRRYRDPQEAHDRCIADATHLVIEVPKTPASPASAASAPTIIRR